MFWTLCGAFYGSQTNADYQNKFGRDEWPHQLSDSPFSALHWLKLESWGLGQLLFLNMMK